MPFAEEDKVRITSRHARFGIGETSAAGEPLAECEMFGEVALVQPPHFRVKIHRILNRRGIEQFFCPSAKGLIVTCTEGHIAALDDLSSVRLTAADEREESLTEFFSLRKSDKVVIRSPDRLAPYFDGHDTVGAADTIIATVINVAGRELSGIIEVRLRSIVTPERRALTLKPKMTLDKFGIVRPAPFQVRAEDIRKAKAEDELKSCTAEPTLFDRIAIHAPAFFIARVAKYNWVTVKSLIKKGNDNSQRKLTHNFGGMDALLEYRHWLCEHILASVQPLAYLNARAIRTDQILGASPDPSEMDDFDRDYLKATKLLGWEAPGSTEVTSDIDVNTFGDGTEWAVRLANFIYRSLHDGNESGTVFDVNVYAQDFLPSFRDQFKLRQVGEDAAALEPDYAHRFQDGSEPKETDAESQLESSLLHLRRYVTGAEWLRFRDLVAERIKPNDPRRGEVERLTADVSHTYQRNLAALARLIRDLVRDRKVRDEEEGELHLSLDFDPNSIESCERVIHHELVPEDIRLRAENQLYENCLLEPLSGVAALRALFNLEKHRLTKRTQGAPAMIGDWDRRVVDWAYGDLRAQLCRALYFANEAYSTEGSLIQVVAGKQGFSRGTAMDRAMKVRCHNIRYTADQLIHTMTEQVGDIFKQSNRKYQSEPHGTAEEQAAAYGAAILDSAKYLHRYFNAMKYLYALLNSASPEKLYLVVQAEAYSEDDYHRVLDSLMELADAKYPLSLMREDLSSEQKAKAFESLRRACGAGLGMLKKFDFSKANADQRRDLAHKLALTERELPETPNRGALGRVIVQTHFQALRGEAFENVVQLEGLQNALLAMHAAVLDDYLAFKRQNRAPPPGAA